MPVCMPRSTQLGLAAAATGPVFGEGHALFSVDGDRALAICACLSGTPFLANVPYVIHCSSFRARPGSS